MKTTSALYKSLRREIGAWYEVEVVRGGVSYGIDKLKSLKLYPALFESNKGAPQIGGVCSTQCNLTLMESSANWPRMAEFFVRVRLNNADSSQQSEWLVLGTFYTDKRSENNSGDLTIVAYDAMLKTEQFWANKIPSVSLPANWPITSKAFCDMLEGQNLITIDSRTMLDNTLAFIGLDTGSTIRDVLRSIASAHGQNWTVTSDGKFRLVPFVSGESGSAALAGIAIAGITIVGDSSIDTEALNDEYAYLGMLVKDLSTSPPLPQITGVSLETSAGDAAIAGTTNGYVVRGDCDWSVSTGIAAMCLNNIENHVYLPFQATGALLDPATELGDLVVIDGAFYQIMSIDWNINTWPTAAISAPYDEEVDHEFKTLSPEEKTYRKSLASTDAKLTLYPTTSVMESAIQQSEEAITLSVSQTYVKSEDYNTAIANLQSQIDGQISTYSGAVVPTLSNYPASDWTTVALKSQHVGALYLVTSDGGAAEAGQYYRFEQNGNNFAWVLVEDSALATALANAAAAQADAEAAQAAADAAQEAADAAQGTADQARLDAVAEAAQAQALAITAAAVDATTKANQALLDAKAYADEQVENFVTGEYAETLAEVREQLDQKIETYYQTADPSDSWNESTEHTGDLWYNTSTQLYYRWNGTDWEELTSNPPTAVFDRIDGKARVFVSQPVPPYDIGDMWVQGATGDILKCAVAKTEGESFATSDWNLASKYTDDSALSIFLNGEFAETIAALKQQLDEKAETFYQEDDPSNGGKTWDTIAGRAIVGVSIVGSTLDLHVGDLWYRTTDGKTFRWNGTAWEEQEISDEMFDMIDGRAQIFVGSAPTPPYNVGDLWFIDETNAIYTCVNEKAVGESYSFSDWEVKNKYTDDTKANAVDVDLQGYKTTTNATLNVHSNRIDAKVESKGGNNSSFGWELTNSDWSLYSNNSRVFRATSAGIEITGSGSFSGEITATSGTFTGVVNATGGTFTGAVTAQNLTITGGSISIGGGQGEQPTFYVSSSGALTATSANISGTVNATSGSFKGAIYAESGTFSGNITSSATITGGTISGTTIQAGTITGGTITGTSVGSSTITGNTITGGTISGTSISGSTISGNTITGGTISGTAITGGSISIGNGKFVVDAEGNLTATTGTFLGNVQAKNIQAGAEAGYITNSQIGTGTILGSNINPGTIEGSNIAPLTIGGGNIANGTLSDSQIQNSSISTASLSSGVNSSLASANLFGTSTVRGGTHADYFYATQIAAGSFYSDDYYVASGADAEYNLAGHYHSFTESDGKIYIGAPTNDASHRFFNIADTQFYKDGVSAVTATAIHYEIGESGDTDYTSIWVSLSNSKSVAGFDNSEAYNSGINRGANSVEVTGATTAISNTHLIEDGHHYVVTTITPTARAEKADGTYATADKELAERRITADDVFTAGAQSATITSITTDTSRSATYYSNKTMDIPVQATTGTGTVFDDFTLTEVNVYDAWAAGESDGKAAYQPTSIDVSYSASADGTYFQITPTAKNAVGTAVYTPSSPTNTSREVYNNGVDRGAATAAISSIAPATGSWSGIWTEGSTYKASRSVTATPYGTNSSSQSVNGTSRTMSVTFDVTSIYEAGKSSGDTSGYERGYNAGALTADIRNVSVDTILSTDTWTSGGRRYATATVNYCVYGVYYNGTRTNTSTTSVNRSVDIQSVWSQAEYEGFLATDIWAPTASGAPSYDEDNTQFTQLITCQCSNGKTSSNTITINAGAAYSHGHRDGKASVSIKCWVGDQTTNPRGQKERYIYVNGDAWHCVRSSADIAVPW